MKQTALEYFWENLDVDIRLFIHCKDIYEQAKAMEKEQIEKALLTGLVHWDVDKPIEQYYNETYKNTNDEKRID